MRDRVSFHRLDAVSDDYGNETGGYAASAFLTVWGRFQPQRGREALEAGRLESSVAGILTIRQSTEADAVTAADQVRIGGAEYQIRAIVDPTQRGAYWEISVERGVGQG